MNLKSVLPSVDFPMRRANVLNLVHTNIPVMYQAEPHPYLSYSDHTFGIQIYQMLKTGSEADETGSIVRVTLLGGRAYPHVHGYF